MSRMRFRVRKTFMNVVLILGMFPGIMAVTAIYFILKALGLSSGTMTTVALILVYSAGSGAGFYVMKGYMDTIPTSLDEAALLDGCTRFQVFHKIIIPICKPMIVYQAIIGFIVAGIRKRINVYDSFVEGAKEGFSTAVRIIPYLVAILVGIGVFRASGAMDYLIDGIGNAVKLCGIDSDFVGALPTALMKPLSGSGARGLMVDAMTTYGPDSFVGRLSCIFQGSTDTTFYILAVYFGSVGIVRTRHAVPCGLLADAAGVIAAILICYLFFG